MTATSAHAFSLVSNSGTTVPLKCYAGKVLLIVNTASRCGLTPQYAGLTTLHNEFNNKGLVILAVPANEFGGQEPGTNEEIHAFCSTKFKIPFPLMAKTVVKGPRIDPLFDWLTTKSPFPGEISWNFAKFLIGPDGQVLARFEPTTKPDDPSIHKAITTALTGLSK